MGFLSIPGRTNISPATNPHATQEVKRSAQMNKAYGTAWSAGLCVRRAPCSVLTPVKFQEVPTLHCYIAVFWNCMNMYGLK